jgi:hypothetical protein
VAQIWHKLGAIFNTPGDRPWMVSHAMVPTPIRLQDGRFRVFVAFVDADRRGRLGFADLDGADPTRVLGHATSPCLDLGAPGTFDEDGVTPLSVRRDGGRLYLYYAGWQRIPSIRYTLFTGLAWSDDEGMTFHRYSQVPILDRRDDELIVRSSGTVVPNPSGGFVMFYAGGSRTIEVGGKLVPTYDLRWLESTDGLCWPGEATPCLLPQPGEFGFARPAVLREGGRWRMWLSLRFVERGYRIGYAESVDGKIWRRQDEAMAGVDVTPGGPDGEMMAYPAIITTEKARFMLYNGNDYGRTGICMMQAAIDV